MTFSLPQKNDFAHKIYIALLTIPRGKVTTYKALANAVGTNAYRAVGSAMHKNPYAPQVPCHRVINNDGRIGGFAYGSDRKITLLQEEGINIENDKVPEEFILRTIQ